MSNNKCKTTKISANICIFDLIYSNLNFNKIFMTLEFKYYFITIKLSMLTNSSK